MTSPAIPAPNSYSHTDKSLRNVLILALTGAFFYYLAGALYTGIFYAYQRDFAIPTSWVTYIINTLIPHDILIIYVFVLLLVFLISRRIYSLSLTHICSCMLAALACWLALFIWSYLGLQYLDRLVLFWTSRSHAYSIGTVIRILVRPLPMILMALLAYTAISLCAKTGWLKASSEKLSPITERHCVLLGFTALFVLIGWLPNRSNWFYTLACLPVYIYAAACYPRTTVLPRHPHIVRNVILALALCFAGILVCMLFIILAVSLKGFIPALIAACVFLVCTLCFWIDTCKLVNGRWQRWSIIIIEIMSTNAILFLTPAGRALVRSGPFAEKLYNVSLLCFCVAFLFWHFGRSIQFCMRRLIERTMGKLSV